MRPDLSDMIGLGTGALPEMRAAIAAAKAENRPLAVYPETQRVLRAYPYLELAADSIAEQIMRLATTEGVAIEVG